LLNILFAAQKSDLPANRFFFILLFGKLQKS